MQVVLSMEKAFIHLMNVSYAESQLTSTLSKLYSSNEEARLIFQMFRYVFVRLHYCVHM